MNNQEQIMQWLNDHREDFIRDVSELVTIPSVRGQAEPGAPFGKAPAAALAAAIAMCRRYGFHVSEYDGYVARAEMNDGPAIMDMLCHLDVVAAGDGWTTDPFKAIVKEDGCIYGRGVSDDKGPFVAALYAMRAASELVPGLSANVRLIMGTDEECGSGDIAYYYNLEKPAPNTVSPDADFPVYNTEKGRYAPQLEKHWAKEASALVSVSGGVQQNVLPAVATAVVKNVAEADLASLEKKAKELGVTVELTSEGENTTVKVTGRGAHASTPDNGCNGITALLSLLCGFPLGDGEAVNAVKALADLFPHGDHYGRALGVAMADALSGPLTSVLSMIKLDDTGLWCQFDSRTPVCANEENCYAVIRQRAEAAGFAIQGTPVEPHHTPSDSEFVQTLLACYTAVTGLPGECCSMGGGTYVHHIPGGVAFGPVMPGCVTNLHGADENIPVDDLLKTAAIYTDVILTMCKRR